MKRKVVIGVVVVVIAGMCAGFFLYQKPTEKVVTTKAEIVVDAKTLYNEYNRNEEKANRKYLNKVIAVTGAVAEVTKTDSLGVTIVLAADNALYGINCHFADSEVPHKVRRGNVVSIRGLCAGKLMDVVLVKCVIDQQ